MARLNDTEALVRQGIKKPQLKTAGGSGYFGDETEIFSPRDDAAAAVSGPQPGRFQRDTGAGNSSLAAAVACANGECDE